MYNTRTMQDRLLRIYANAPREALDRADWYASVAGRDVESIAADTGVPFRTVAAAMAILSPGPQYAVNVADTRRMCQWAGLGANGEPPTVSTYGANREKCAAMLRSWAVARERSEPASYVSGPKVTAFYRNIIGDLSHVTLDRHAVRPLSKAGKDMPANKAERARMEDAYRRAAAKVGLEPAAFQAAVWCAVRGAAR